MNALFIVGAQRSGSTYLYKILDNHPQVAMARPLKPEPKFFLQDHKIGRGKAFFEETYFQGRNDRALYVGEKSTSYIESVDAAKGIQSFYPDARILMILRDPVLRAYSNYRFSVKHQLEQSTFSEALKAEPGRLTNAKFSTSVSPYAYRQRGYYINYVRAYLEIFHSRQVRILIFEELVNNLVEIQSLYNWLGLDPGVVPESHGEIVNAGPTEMGNHDQLAFQDLALGYANSITELESLLGRELTTWRQQHSALGAGR